MPSRCVRSHVTGVRSHRLEREARARTNLDRRSRASRGPSAARSTSASATTKCTSADDTARADDTRPVGAAVDAVVGPLQQRGRVHAVPGPAEGSARGSTTMKDAPCPGAL